MLITIGVYMGRLETEMRTAERERLELRQSLHQYMVTFASELSETREIVREHHEDTDRHIDAQLKADLLRRLDTLTNLALQQLNNSRRIQRAP